MPISESKKMVSVAASREAAAKSFCSHPRLTYVPGIGKWLDHGKCATSSRLTRRVEHGAEIPETESGE